MWRALRSLIADCIHFVMRCTRNNPEIDDIFSIPDYNIIQEFPENVQPEAIEIPEPPRRQNDLQHRPDTPRMTRRSPPEVVKKMLQALEEMKETDLQTITISIGDGQLPLEPRVIISPNPSTADR